MGLVSADRFNELKARVKAECARRAYADSVASYGGTDYDYTTTPASGTLIKQEHRDKIAIPLNAISEDMIPIASGLPVVLDEDLLSMEAFITVLEQRSPTDSEGTDCSGGCAGMCYGCQGTCYNNCSGCGNSCSNNCSGGCKGGCTSDCGGCGGSCDASCEGGCLYSCYDICSGCGGACSNDCKGSCAGCGATCASSSTQ